MVTLEEFLMLSASVPPTWPHVCATTLFRLTKVPKSASIVGPVNPVTVMSPVIVTKAPDVRIPEAAAVVMVKSSKNSLESFTVKASPVNSAKVVAPLH
jgi:hypothetical protein